MPLTELGLQDTTAACFLSGEKAEGEDGRRVGLPGSFLSDATSGARGIGGAATPAAGTVSIL